MQDYGYPSPPASPTAYDERSCLASPPPPQQQQQQQQPLPPSFLRPVPVEPEARLGRLLDGKLQLVRILGTGAYGVVYFAVDVKTGVQYAVKCLSKFNPDGTPLDRRQVSFQNREIRLHYLASAHRNVVSMLKIVDDDDCIFVILEYCHEGDLFFNITERGHYVGQDELARRIFLQILDAVEHCHSLRIYHRDLKPENILVSDNGETAKLADFGLATSSDRSEDYGCGSTFYMSPECLDHSAGKPFYMCAPNDVWSLGVVLVNLTCGRNPWKQASLDDTTYRAYSECRSYLKTILPVTDELNDILASIFTANPERRITLPELRARIVACGRFTRAGTGTAAAQASVPAVDTMAVSPPPSPEPYEHITVCALEEQQQQQQQYADATAAEMGDDGADEFDQYEECIDEQGDQSEDEEDGYDTPLSPVSSISDDGSLTSSVSSIDDFDEPDFFDDDEQQQQRQPCPSPITFEPDMSLGPASAPFHPVFHPGQEFVPQHYMGPAPVLAESQHHQHHHLQPTGPIPIHMPAQTPMPVPNPCSQQLKSYFSWDLARFTPVMQGIPFYNQVPNFFPVFQMST